MSTPTQTTVQFDGKPHILTLSLRYDEFDPEMPLHADDGSLTCPYDLSPLMPCATWEPCGCPVKASEITDEDWGTGEGPCKKSATGEHRYVEGEPNLPIAECWARTWEQELVEDAQFRPWGPGRYTVAILWNGDCPEMELWPWVPTATEATHRPSRGPLTDLPAAPVWTPEVRR